MTRGEGGRGQWEKEGEESGQGTCLKDSWTWKAGWGLTVGLRNGQGRGEKQGKKLGQV